jgi:hypothetical protein
MRKRTRARAALLPSIVNPVFSTFYTRTFAPQKHPGWYRPLPLPPESSAVERRGLCPFLCPGPTRMELDGRVQTGREALVFLIDATQGFRFLLGATLLIACSAAHH